MIVPTVVLASGYRARQNEHYLKLIDGQKRYHSPKIIELVNRYLANRRAFNDFQFKQEVLKAAMSLMSTPSLKAWVSIQDTMGINHRNFLIETFKYILNGERPVEHSSWIRLLRNDEGSYTLDGEEYFTIRTPVQGQFLVANERLVRISHHFPTTVNRWISYETGLPDLLLTLGVIFGNYYQGEAVCSKSLD